jgi:hypothetical protein
MAIGASQLHTLALFLEFKCLLQHEVHCASTVGGRSFRDVFKVLFHERHYFRVFQVRNQKIALHPHDLLLAERKG